MSKQSNKALKELKPPKTAMQEVLFTLINKGYVSLFDFGWMQGYRTRVSEIVNKHNLPLLTVHDSRYNKFGNKYTYAIHKLPKEAKNKAIEIYNNLKR